MTQTEPDVAHSMAVIRAILEQPAGGEHAGRVNDLAEAQRLAEELIAAFPHIDEVRDDARFHAAWACDDLFELTGEKRHLDREIDHLRAGVHAGVDTMVELLVEAHIARHRVGEAGQTMDIDAAIELHRILLDAADEPEAPAARTKLGLLVAERFRTSPPADPEELQNLDEAIELLSEARHTVPHDDPDRVAVIGSLGHLYVVSHMAPRVVPGAPDARDLDRGIELLRSVADANDFAADRLAFALDLRFNQRERPEDRDEAIELYEGLCAADPVYLDEYATDLGTLYVSRLEEAQDDHTFERAVACLDHAIRLRQSDSECLNVYLVEAYVRRWGRVPAHELDRLRTLCTEMSIRDADELFWTVMALGIDAETACTSGSHDSIRACVTRLSDVVTGPHHDQLNEATLMGVAAVLIAQSRGCGTPPDWSPFTAVALDSTPDDVLPWLRGHRNAIPEDSPDHAMFVAGIAFVAGQVSTEFDERVADLEAALSALPSDHPMVPLVLFVLGRAYQSASDATTPERLRRCIELLTSASARLGSDDPLRTECVGFLGSALITGYGCRAIGQSHLEHADALITEALSDPDLYLELRALLLATLGLVRGVSWLLDPSNHAMGEGLALHEQAMALLPADTLIGIAIRINLGYLLLSRSVVTRNLGDVAQAENHLRTVAPLVEKLGDTDLILPEQFAEALRLTRLLRMASDDEIRAEDAVELDALIADLGKKTNPDFADAGVLAWAEALRAQHNGDNAEMMKVFNRLGHSLDDVPEHVPFRDTIVSVKSLHAGADAMLNGDLTGLRGHVDDILERAASPEVVNEERARLLYIAGGLWRTAHTKTGDATYLDDAISHLEDAYEIAVDTVEPYAMYSAELLAEVYWLRDRQEDADRSIRWGFTALREHARQVLLHEHLEHGATKASTVVEHSHALTHHCASAGRPADAVAAIEGGRALAMHAATSGELVGTLLRELGHENVALQWIHSLRDGSRREDRVEAADDLRYRVLDLLAGTDAEQRLLAAPSPAEVALALRETGGDALVYLVPAAGKEPGRALLADSRGEISAIPLPQLTTSDGSPVERYLTAHRLATTTYGEEQASAVIRWRAELDELLWWAWPAVVGPVLAELARTVPDRTPRLVLVPCGPLGVVPWHAVRFHDSGRTRFAIEQAVFSYGASARQLCDVAARQVRDLVADVAVLTNPEEDLFGGTKETRYLHRFLYPDADYYGLLPAEIGEAGEGSPDDVLALLPRAEYEGVSLLHLACHAWTGPTPARSYLQLADGARLTVDEILRHTRGRAKDASGGGLVVLSACGSDLADRDHDEALTVSSALLAGGAGSVVGTRWQVGDLPSALLMCLFHRYLTIDRMSPAEALRAAQLWALDRDSVLPDDIASVFGTVSEIPLTTWAAFSHQGR